MTVKNYSFTSASLQDEFCLEYLVKLNSHVEKIYCYIYELYIAVVGAIFCFFLFVLTQNSFFKLLLLPQCQLNQWNPLPPNELLIYFQLFHYYQSETSSWMWFGSSIWISHLFILLCNCLDSVWYFMEIENSYSILLVIVNFSLGITQILLRIIMRVPHFLGICRLYSRAYEIKVMVNLINCFIL